MDLLCLWTFLRRTRQKNDDLGLRRIRLDARGNHDGFERFSRRVEELCRRGDSLIGLNRTLPRGIQIFAGNLSLSRQNLPDSHLSLKGPERIRAQRLILNRINTIGRSHKIAYRCIVELRKFDKDRIPVAKLDVLGRKQSRSVVRQAATYWPFAVNRAQEQINLRRSVIRRIV